MRALAVLAVVGLVGASFPIGPRPRLRGGESLFGGGVVAPLGRRVRRRPDTWSPRFRALSDRTFGVAALAAVSGLAAPPLLIAGPVGVLVFASGRARRDERRRGRRLEHDLAVVVEHLGLAVAAGLTIGRALAAIAPRLPPEHAHLLAETLARVSGGSSLADALGWWGRCLGPAADELVAVLVAAERDGAPLAAGLARVAGSVRRARRREVEARARRLPVTMLLPLVCCVLPAFVLLSLVPVLAGSLRGLRFPG